MTIFNLNSLENKECRGIIFLCGHTQEKINKIKTKKIYFSKRKKKHTLCTQTNNANTQIFFLPT